MTNILGTDLADVVQGLFGNDNIDAVEGTVVVDSTGTSIRILKIN